MEQDDFNLEQFVDLFDTAMSSDNPTVRRAFKNLMLVAALADSENENKTGPLRNLVEKVKSLEGRISAVEWKTNINSGTIVGGGAVGSGSIGQPVPLWTSTTNPTISSGTYTLNTQTTSSSAGAKGPSASTANYMTMSYNYDTLFDTLESKINE